MGRWLLILSIAWLLLLASALANRIVDAAAPWSAAVYLAASQICHQRPDRSFHTAGVAWPVCGRCAGLYLSAPLGAWWAWRRSGRSRPTIDAPRLLAWAAVPTALTLGVEWAGVSDPGSMGRFLAAWPLGGALGFVLVQVVESRSPIAIG